MTVTREQAKQAGNLTAYSVMQAREAFNQAKEQPVNCEKPWNAKDHEESYIESCRRRVEEQYANTRLSSGAIGGCFGAILCSELHHGKDGYGLDFCALAAKWNIPVSILGELIWDHCKRLEPLLEVNHQYEEERSTS